MRDVFGAFYSQLGFDHLLSVAKKSRQWNEMLKTVVLIRFLEPASKLRSIDLGSFSAVFPDFDTTYGLKFFLSQFRASAINCLALKCKSAKNWDFMTPALSN